jgi:hypothetical protein
VGLVIVLVASVLNGVSLEWSTLGSQLTVRLDQVALASFLPFVAVAWILRRLHIRMGLFDWTVVGFLISNAAAAIFISPVAGSSIKGTLLLACYGAMYLVVKQVVAQRGRWIRPITNWVCGLGIAQAAYSILAVALYPSGVIIGGLQVGHLTEGSIATKGTFWEANLLGAYLGLIALVLVVRYMFGSTKHRRTWCLVGVFAAGLALPLTMTRAAGVGTAAGVSAIVLLAWAYRREFLEWKSRIGRILVAFGCVAVLSGTAMNVLVSRASGYPNLLLERWAPSSWVQARDESPGPGTARPTPSRGPAPGLTRRPATATPPVERASHHSVTGRLAAWNQAVVQWRESPVLGHGTLAGSSVIQDGWWYSSLVQALHDTGLVGFSLLLWLHVGAVLYPVRAWLRTRRTPMSEDLLALGAANALLVFTSQFSNFFFLGLPWVVLGLSMGAVEAYSTNGRTGGGRDQPAPLPA